MPNSHHFRLLLCCTAAVPAVEEWRQHHLRKELIIAIVLSSIAGVMIAGTVLYAFILCRHSRRSHDSKDIRSSSDTARVALVPMLSKFNSMKSNKKGLVAMMEYNSLEAATGKFSESNLLGAGGFGCVYKANFEGGLVAAVKRFGHLGQECEKEFEISDFGLAVTSGNHSKGNLKLSGTLGYVAPEYLLDGKLTEKSDVYAFGVVLLELLLGRRPVEKTAQSQCQSIVTWAMPQLTDRSKLPSIIDPMIKNTMDLKHLYQVAAVAVLCVQPEPSYRPLITDVLHSLIPLVPMELGGTLRVSPESPCAIRKHSPS
uniref:Protein kinase domain-containing protein n=1 Tax=Leersia perrieri TaxID=77586 RepID=A0A0D9VD09_9ORYZ